MKSNLMNGNVWSLLALMSIATLTACSTSENGGDNGKDNEKELVLANNATLTGDIDGEKTIILSKGFNFTLSGEYTVKAGSTLRIAEGVTITAKSNDNVIDYILVEQGGKIEAVGTAAAPIVMTAENEEAGAWGGLHICGRAPINIGSTGKSEVGDAPYGGTDADDNSGTLKYIRLEYAGYKFTSEKECNGFTFYGVGRGTTLEYLEAYKGSDDGFEWFGGTVNAKYLMSVSNSDDSFDWTEGWSGKAQFLVAYQESAATLGYTCDCLIEADNYDKNMDAKPVSSPTLANLTLIGADNPEGKRGVRLRAGTQAKIYNALVTGKSSNLTTETRQTEGYLVDGTSILNYIAIVGDISAKGDGGYSSALFTAAANNNAINQNITFTKTIIGTQAGGADLSTKDNFFINAPYKGAVSADNDWTKGWSKL
ncbi:hypothetical protein [Bacteroides neonati]|uniref:hypothetical protein n=1 Tax=Bacteroides neonati TaxID=1347393 RepID=UPI0004B95068|nr:hypothetical protein [Bacteroides neonati]